MKHSTILTSAAILVATFITINVFADEGTYDNEARFVQQANSNMDYSLVAKFSIQNIDYPPVFIYESLASSSSGQWYPLTSSVGTTLLYPVNSSGTIYDIITFPQRLTVDYIQICSNNGDLSSCAPERFFTPPSVENSLNLQKINYSKDGETGKNLLFDDTDLQGFRQTQSIRFPQGIGGHTECALLKSSYVSIGLSRYRAQISLQRCPTQ